ncbi:hypothetical protein BKI52_33395 [marine bacterium AO1-C]|nr:hypothetical protein BKI52_33395 [marine bacterium AO1-C]
MTKNLMFKDIYNQTIKYYPSEIDISDGKKIEKGGGYFETLSKSCYKAELNTEKESDFIQLMVWAIFCAYHQRAIDNFLNGKKKVFSYELDMEYLKFRFEESLLLNPELAAQYKADTAS